jgi:cyclopropane-fatty-acyl-phospholipid synthase
MDFIVILFWIIIFIVLFMVFKNLVKIFMPKPAVLYMLSTFVKGNFVLIDSSDMSEILKVVNDTTKPIPTVYIKNQNNFFSSVYKKSELGLGESYMRGEWECDDLIEFLNTLCLNQSNPSIPSIELKTVSSKSEKYDKSNIVHHYDVGNDFYLQFLRDDLNAYSCGFWFSPTDTLNTAQYNKVNTVIKKLNAKPGSSILDIGCGWGKIANYVSEKTSCKVTGITVSDEQEKYALSNYNPEKVVIINMDYRNISGQFDYIYSIGMFEHVRYENYDLFFQMIKRCLKPGGRLVLHTIITFDKSNPVAKSGDNFVTTHIFPGGQIPQSDWIVNKARDNGLNIIHFEGFGGQHYAKTLKTWRENMWMKKEYIRTKYPEELMLKYDYYFAICEAGFNTGILGIGHYIITNEQVMSLSNSFGYL